MLPLRPKELTSEAAILGIVTVAIPARCRLSFELARVEVNHV